MVYVLIFIFGTIIGSFLNVVILRYHSGNSTLKGSSRCFYCGKNLTWPELIPVFSFLIQKRRCKKCGAKISWQYPAVEIITGLLFLLIFNEFFPIFSENRGSSISLGEIGTTFNILYLWILAGLLIVIAVYDLRHFIIPNLFVWLFNFFAFLSVFGILNPDFIWKLEIEKWKFAGLNILGGLIFSAFFAFLWFVSRGRWMGFGDAKLALGIGWFLGPFNTLWAFFFSFWLGGIVSIFLLLLKKSKFSIKSKIPFAPFLAIGSLLAFFLDIGDVFHLFFLW